MLPRSLAQTTRQHLLVPNKAVTPSVAAFFTPNKAATPSVASRACLAPSCLSNQARTEHCFSIIIAHSSHRRSFFPSLRRRPLRPIRRWCYCWVSLSKQVLRNAVDFLRVFAPPRIMHRATASGCFKFIVFYPLSCQVRFGVDQVVGLVMWKKYHCMKMSFC